MEARLISPEGATSLSMTEIRDAAARDGGTLWLDFGHTDEDSMALLGELIDVRPTGNPELHHRFPGADATLPRPPPHRGQRRGPQRGRQPAPFSAA